MDLHGRTVVITGGAANIGRAVALEFAKKGAQVVVNTRSNVAGGKGVIEEIAADGGEGFFVQADVTEPEEVDRLFTSVEETYGTPDILVNNAGAARPTQFAGSTKAQWQEVFDVNFFSAVLCSQRVAAGMKQKGRGHIINTSSVRGIDHTGREGIMAYSAAKAALVNFTKTLAKELAPTVKVNAIAPGFVQSSAYDNVPEETKEGFLSATLIGRWITPEELAPSYVYLAEQEAMTGTVVTVDGGFTLKMA